jgi:hypothetical protein
VACLSYFDLLPPTPSPTAAMISARPTNGIQNTKIFTNPSTKLMIARGLYNPVPCRGPTPAADKDSKSALSPLELVACVIAASSWLGRSLPGMAASYKSDELVLHF